MKSRWNDEEARKAVARYAAQGTPEDLAIRTYSARLIGADAALVLHGGGNTSVKSRARDIRGHELEVLHIKGSGWDLATIEPPGHPAVKMGALLPLRELSALSDEEMVNQMRLALMDATAPNPSVEALLHAFLPHKFIDHTHADAVLALVDQPEAEAALADIYGDEVAIVPYIMPGFALAKLAAEIHERHPAVKGMMLLRHGVFSFGAYARESYERMIELVDKAEKALARRRRPVKEASAFDRASLEKRYAAMAPALRGALALEASDADPWRRFILEFRTSPAILNFLARPDLSDVSARGTATPDHVIRTKPQPLILGEGADPRPAVAAFRASYHEYFADSSSARKAKRKELDGMPRVVLIPGVGLAAAGEDAAAAAIAADLYEHTISIIEDALAYGDYRPLGRHDLFDMEYWSLEQAKLGKKARQPLEGQVALITGAGSGIGAEIARVFAAAGAHLALFDRDAALLGEVKSGLPRQERVLAEVLDVTDSSAVERGIERTVARFGGLDIAVSNAGRAYSVTMENCPPATLAESFALNCFSHHYVAAAAVRVLRSQATGGALLFNASKSAFNPGPDFGPYAVPKAAVVALMKQYAVENGKYGIRSNAVNADRIRTRIFEAGVLEKRVAARGVTIDQYFRDNLLGREVTARDVADAFLHLALSHKTTGATLPVDGGNIAASPR